ncbi:MULTISPECIES: FAD-binding oxidoreductase [unclassified Streptomyces]|uniref:FAD-binding oxidoreductase n=1 Tax=unclassified Streptomyces TaxID=2593676 RepID=UPI0004C29565|nr:MULTISPECIES: FAD-binding oxidoreductase [unclassified Streptomyces]
MTTATRDLAGPTAHLAEIAPGRRVETGPGATGPYAYDASNYRVPPRAVAFPHTADDVVAVLRARGLTWVSTGRLSVARRIMTRTFVAVGFSCATQIDHLAGDRDIRALHLAELLDPAADRPGETT